MTNTQTARILSQNEGHIWAAICRTARFYGVTLSAADEADIFQDVMVSALSAFAGESARWDSRRWESVPAYIRKIAAHRTVDFLRARKAEVDPAILDSMTAGQNPEQAYCAAERADSAVRCYLHLSASERRAVDSTFSSDGAGDLKTRVAKHRAVARMGNMMAVLG